MADPCRALLKAADAAVASACTTSRCRFLDHAVAHVVELRRLAQALAEQLDLRVGRALVRGAARPNGRPLAMIDRHDQDLSGVSRLLSPICGRSA